MTVFRLKIDLQERDARIAIRIWLPCLEVVALLDSGVFDGCVLLLFLSRHCVPNGYNRKLELRASPVYVTESSPCGIATPPPPLLAPRRQPFPGRGKRVTCPGSVFLEDLQSGKQGKACHASMERMSGRSDMRLSIIQTFIEP